MTNLTYLFQFKDKGSGKILLEEIGLTLSPYSNAGVLPLEIPDNYPVLCEATGALWGIGYLDGDGKLDLGNIEGSRHYFSEEQYSMLKNYQRQIRKSFGNFQQKTK